MEQRQFLAPCRSLLAARVCWVSSVGVEKRNQHRSPRDPKHKIRFLKGRREAVFLLAQTYDVCFWPVKSVAVIKQLVEIGAKADIAQTERSVENDLSRYFATK